MSATTKKKVITLSQRELNIDYNVDFTPVKDLALKYEIDFQDMKKALRDCGFTIRKNEPEPDAPERDYVVKVELDGKAPVKAPKAKVVAPAVVPVVDDTVKAVVTHTNDVEQSTPVNDLASL